MSIAHATRTPHVWALPVLVGLALVPALARPSPAGPPVTADPFARFTLPEEWQSRFWSSPNARALFAMNPKDAAGLVPVQAGVRFCRCPSCDTGDDDDSFSWSLTKPKQIACRRCGVVAPNDKAPSRAPDEKAAPEDKKAVPEDAVEVRPGVVHHYPYHLVEPERQHYPGERLYLSARADHEAREFLAKAALYAAVRYRSKPLPERDPKLARVASALLLRFAQVYPSYATHFDQPSSPKHFDKADLPPPYRLGYKTAKWDWSGSLDVPLNLVVAYALLRDDPALAEAGRLLGEPDPRKVIEHDLFRASAGFVRRQPEEVSEAALQADRGILAVGRLLDDPVLIGDALDRLDRFAERGFYHDGFWRQGTLASHRRVVALLDGWLDLLLAGSVRSAGLALVKGRKAEVPMLALARSAGAAVLTEPVADDVRLASWPAPAPGASPRAPTLLGGTGLARLAVGHGENALDLELRSLDAFGPDGIVRQALRFGVGGRTVLGDLDESPPLVSGWDRSSLSHNTVIVDGLNQRESLAKAQEPASGGNFLYFAAEPDFQVATLDDPRAYPQSTTRYRQTVVASAGDRARYALSVFEVRGGLQHDQVFHGPSGGRTGWQLSVPTSPGPDTLLPQGLAFVPTARAADGRWFIQAFGELRPDARATLTHPATATWAERGAAGSHPGARLHILGDTPFDAVTALGPDALSQGKDDSGRAALVLRRRSESGDTLNSLFVTVFEPIFRGTPPLKRVGRVASPSGTVVVYLETPDGSEHVVLNLSPGTVRAVTLADGRALTTDGLAVRVTSAGLVLAGGTFAEVGGGQLQARQSRASGKLVGVVRRPSTGSRGWFETDAPLPDLDALAGRVVTITHGDDSTRGWTVERAENTRNGARLYLREEPGFALDPASKAARYYQFPQLTAPGPHHFRVGKIARSAKLSGVQ